LRYRSADISRTSRATSSSGGGVIGIGLPSPVAHVGPAGAESKMRDRNRPAAAGAKTRRIFGGLQME